MTRRHAKRWKASRLLWERLLFCCCCMHEQISFPCREPSWQVLHYNSNAPGRSHQALKGKGRWHSGCYARKHSWLIHLFRPFAFRWYSLLTRVLDWWWAEDVIVWYGGLRTKVPIGVLHWSITALYCEVYFYLSVHLSISTGSFPRRWLSSNVQPV